MFGLSTKKLQKKQIEALTKVVSAIDRLTEEVHNMVSRLDDEFAGLQQALAALRTAVEEGLAKVVRILASIDLSQVEGQAQTLLAEAQSTLETVQTAFAGLPEPPSPVEPPVE